MIITIRTCQPSFCVVLHLSPVRRGIRQHALLNLVRMHYVRKEYPVAREVRAYLENCPPDWTRTF